MGTTEHSQPFSRETLFRQIGPLVGAVFLWLIYSNSEKLPDEDSLTLLWAAAMIAVAVVLTVTLPWHRLPRFAMLVPPLVYLLAASGFGPGQGDPLSSWAGLFLLPVFWISVYATGLELAAGVVAVAIAIFTPLGSPGYHADPTQALVLIALAGALGVGTHRLFEDVRSRTGGTGRVGRADILTGVASRKAWEGALLGQLEEARRSEVPLSVAILNVDHLQAYNDRFGEQAGDRLLKFFTARWLSELRGDDLLARMAGDEFAVLLPRTHAEAGAAVIRRLCSVPASTTTSAGVACWDGRESVGELIARAERALYQAKQAGRSRIVLAETPPPPAPPRAPDGRAPDIHLGPSGNSH